MAFRDWLQVMWHRFLAWIDLAHELWRRDDPFVGIRPTNYIPTKVAPPLEVTWAKPGKKIEPSVAMVNSSDVRAAIMDALDHALGDGVWSEELLGILMAHSALETGHWKALRNFNMGNVKAHDPWVEAGGDYVFYECSENLSPERAEAYLDSAHRRADDWDMLDVEVRYRGERHSSVWFYPDHPECRFRAYGSLQEGVDGYIQKLFERYGAAMSWGQLGDVGEFCKALKERGYFTAHLDDYTKAMDRLYIMYYEGDDLDETGLT